MAHIPPHLFDQIVHKALSSQMRKSILLSLTKERKYLSELATELGKKPQTIDFHLSILQEIGLVGSEWDQGKKFYFIKDEHIVKFLREGKAVPPEFRPKPPYEIVLEMWEKLEKRLDVIEEKLDRLLENN